MASLEGCRMFERGWLLKINLFYVNINKLKALNGRISNEKSKEKNMFVSLSGSCIKSLCGGI